MDIEKIMQVIEDVMCEAQVDYPAGYEAGPRIVYDTERIRAALALVVTRTEACNTGESE